MVTSLDRLKNNKTTNNEVEVNEWNGIKLVQHSQVSAWYFQDKDSKEDKSKKKDKEKKEEEKAAGPDLTAQQGVAVLGLALIAMGEDIGAEMCFRSFSHLVSTSLLYFSEKYSRKKYT